MRPLRLLSLAASVAVVIPPRTVTGQVPPAARPAVADAATAELRPEAGARAGYDWDLAAWSLGGQLRVPIVPGLTLMPSADWFFATPGAWQVNLDLAFRLGWYGGLYGGAGLGVAHRPPGSSTRAGLNVFAGFAPPRLGRQSLWPYLEARWLLVQNRSPFSLMAGVNVAL